MNFTIWQAREQLVGCNLYFFVDVYLAILVLLKQCLLLVTLKEMTKRTHWPTTMDSIPSCHQAFCHMDYRRLKRWCQPWRHKNKRRRKWKKVKLITIDLKLFKSKFLYCSQGIIRRTKADDYLVGRLPAFCSSLRKDYGTSLVRVLWHLHRLHWQRWRWGIVSFDHCRASNLFINLPIPFTETKDLTPVYLLIAPFTVIVGPRTDVWPRSTGPLTSRS